MRSYYFSLVSNPLSNLPGTLFCRIMNWNLSRKIQVETDLKEWTLNQRRETLKNVKDHSKLRKDNYLRSTCVIAKNNSKSMTPSTLRKVKTSKVMIMTYRLLNSTNQSDTFSLSRANFSSLFSGMNYHLTRSKLPLLRTNTSSFAITKLCVKISMLFK